MYTIVQQIIKTRILQNIYSNILLLIIIIIIIIALEVLKVHIYCYFKITY
jgi:hypothetical protein